MKNLHTLAVLAAFTAVSLTAHAASPTTPIATGPSRQQQCDVFGNKQFAKLTPQQTSGTTLSSTYDARTGECTIKMQNKGPVNAFFTKFSTNTFETTTGTTERWHLERESSTIVRPVEIISADEVPSPVSK